MRRKSLAEEYPELVCQWHISNPLTELIPELLDLVDGRKMALRPAVELSYLTPDE